MRKTLLSLYLFLLSIDCQSQTIYPSGVAGCIARWNFTNAGPITSLPDVSGNNNNGAAYDLVTDNGFRNLLNKAMKFNGSSSYSLVPNSASLSSVSQVTLLSVVKYDGFYPGTCQISEILSKGYPHFIAGNYGYGVGDNVYDGSCGIYSPNNTEMMAQFNSANSNPPTAGNYVQTGKWYFSAVSYDGNTVKYYQVVMDTSVYYTSISPVFTVLNNNTPIGTNSQDLSIGRHLNPTYPYWVNGSMDEVIIFNRVLADSEIHSVYTYLWGQLTCSVHDTLSACDSFVVNYTTYNPDIFQAGNIFTAELSDATGSFASPTVIGSVASVTTGTITCGIPPSVPPGTGYRIRIEASNSHFISPDNGTNILIGNGASINGSLGNDTSICGGSNLILHPVGVAGNPTYLWSTGSTSSSITVNSTGTYWVYIDNAGCSGSDTIHVDVKPSPVVSLSDSIINCKTLTVKANYVSGDTATQFTWQFGDNSPLVNTNPATHTYGQNGTYNVTLVASNNTGCSDTVSSQISLTANTNYSIDDSAINCKTAKLEANHISGDISAQTTWIFGDDSPIGNGNPTTHIYSQNGAYNVVLIVSDSSGCVDSIMKTVILTADINYGIIDSTITCKTTDLTAVYVSGDTSVQFNWLFGDSTAGSGNPVRHTFVHTGANSASVILTNILGCKDTASANFVIDYQLLVDFTYDPATPEKNTPTNFHNASSPNAILFHWDFGDNTTSAEENPSKLYKKTGNYNVCLTGIDSNGCSATACKTIGADIVEDIELPGAFSPNGDGKNDVLYLKGYSVASVNLIIYNRWGQKVFQSTNMSAGWDGTYKGKQQPAEAYGYTIDATFYSGNTVKKQGNIILLR